VCRRKPRGRGLQREPAVRLGPDVMFDGGRLRAHRRWHWPPSPGRTSARLARARSGHARGRRRSPTAISETTRQSSAQATSRPRRRRSLRPSAECQRAANCARGDRSSPGLLTGPRDWAPAVSARGQAMQHEAKTSRHSRATFGSRTRRPCRCAPLSTAGRRPVVTTFADGRPGARRAAARQRNIRSSSGSYDATSGGCVHRRRRVLNLNDAHAP